MPYIIRLEPRAEKNLNKIPKNFQLKIKAALASLQNNPFLGKKLLGKLKDYYSLKIWPYRIIYTIQKNLNLIIIVEIGHRQGIY